MSLRYSFIIPVYNAEKTLAQCVHSLLGQIRDSEILLINDGSTDGSGKLCDELAAQYPIIRVFHTPNGGISRARNLGVKNAKGERVIFFDSDDYYLHKVFDALDQAIQRFPNTQAVLFDYMVLDTVSGKLTDLNSDRGLKLDQPIEGMTFLDLALKQDPHFRVSACRWAVRRDFILEKRLWFKEDLYFEDMLWVFEVILAAETVLYHPHPIYVYRQNQSTSITGKLDAKKIHDRIWISGYWFDQAPNLIPDSELRTRFLRRTSELAYTALIRYPHVCTSEEAHTVVLALEDNKGFLDYPNTKMYRTLARIGRLIGISATATLYGNLFKIKNGLKSFARS